METWPCTSRFLKLGPEILTRDSDQAHQNSTWRNKKKLKKWPTNGRPKVFQNHEIDEKSTFFFFFFEFAKYCFGELGPNHVSKFQVRTRKNERSTAIFACFERLGRPSLYYFATLQRGCGSTPCPTTKKGGMPLLWL